jgi:hypothetical protein
MTNRLTALRAGIALAAVLTAVTLACNLPAARPTPTATRTARPGLAPTPTPPAPSPAPSPAPPVTPTLTVARPALDSLLADLSADRLMAHVEALAAIETRHANSATASQAAEAVYDAFAAVGDPLAVAYDPFPLDFDDVPTTQVNVVATLPGTDPAAGTILLGAHYDSRAEDITEADARAPGANDNASGVAVLIEVARIMAAHYDDAPPRATVVFAAFAAEEVGVAGSRHYVESVGTRGGLPRAAIVLDIVGNAGGAAGEGAIRVFSAPPDDSPSRQLARTVDLVADSGLSGLDVAVQPEVDRPGRYSDHVPLSDAGVPAVRLIEAVEDIERQHSAADLPGYISPGYLERAARLALIAVYNLANAPPAPHGLARPERGVLAWEPAPGASGYLVALRGEDAPAFGQTLYTAGTRLALPVDALALDFASVAAVGPDGATGMFSSEIPLTP